MRKVPAVRTVLVANRGEIAVRIIRTCRELGLRTVAVYSDADSQAMHVRMADHAERIGPAAARDSYLSAAAIVAAAEKSGADAVHPGYGLLSEDAEFARAVLDAGLVFVGPPPEVVALMGNKILARGAAQACDLPVPPGSAGAVSEPEEAHAVAERIGWPVVVKASFGGGGRGMRVVHDHPGLEGAMAAAAREAGAAFGRSEVHLERYLERPRHVEVQVLADEYGTVLHLGDRDCSVQRRHQKLIEEAPAPDLPAAVRAALREGAVRLAREVGYVGAGTVEFLVLPGTGEYFFLEMNTRLQVEHGVTELVTGLDLVEAQLAVAAGEKIRLAQEDIRLEGHAIQARIAAEEPAESFRPGPGRVTGLTLPQGPWVRCDMGVAAGDTVAAEYDSMFGKVLARGADRDSSRRRLIGALDELRVVGVPTTAAYLRNVLASAEFAEVAHDTGSVERDWVPDPSPLDAPPAETGGLGTAGPAEQTRPVRRVRIATDRGPVDVAVYGVARPHDAAFATGRRPERTERTAVRAADGPGTQPVAPMNATVVSVAVEQGVTVALGDTLLVLEAMKMEIEVKAETAGVVERLRVTVGEPVEAGTILADVVPVA
ncbi:biotin carboxylase N-terminal domain-containing protein [Streptomyces sp. NPDC051985]|uniref:acetyl/propionyl/methylcrotonyl-CoA carboxylase subunit alpha n=1 Tax=Streptomyces sp. NPDC051985 TaxID=3155807 RepID=UPI003428F2C1